MASGVYGAPANRDGPRRGRPPCGSYSTLNAELKCRRRARTVICGVTRSGRSGRTTTPARRSVQTLAKPNDGRSRNGLETDHQVAADGRGPQRCAFERTEFLSKQYAGVQCWRHVSDAPSTSLTVEVVDNLEEVDEAEWDALLGDGDDASPFLEWRFLRSLERAGTLGIDRGWVPRFPLVRIDDRLVAAAPAYIKLHSQGEFVFDFAWANFAERMGVSYYPKLLVGVPFTPVTGRRILTAAGEDRPFLVRAVGQVLVELCEHFELSSVHVNFATEEEVELLKTVGFQHRLGIQYHWYRNGEAGFSDYLGRFNSKRRNQLKRERRELERQGVQVEVLTGHDLTPELTNVAFRIYKSTVDKFYWGRQYLNRRVFELWVETLPERFELVAARTDGGDVVAGAINFVKGRRLYGRYWGCFKELKHLHFNVCYYEGIERAYALGLDVFEPGAGGEHKLVRGFEPTLMNSAHYIRSDRLAAPIAQYLAAERRQIQCERDAMMSATGQKR